jgi:hypothetical protein
MMRHARYSAAVLFALVAAGFAALWVRSYSVRDLFFNADGHVLSYKGVTMVEVYKKAWPLPGKPSRFWSSHPIPATEVYSPWDSGFLGFEVTETKVGKGMELPHWFLAASSLGLAALFAFKRTWRYSLRTILVATMLLAGLLGLAVWAV